MEDAVRKALLNGAFDYGVDYISISPSGKEGEWVVDVYDGSCHHSDWLNINQEQKAFIECLLSYFGLHEDEEGHGYWT